MSYSTWHFLGVLISGIIFYAFIVVGEKWEASDAGDGAFSVMW